MEKKPENKISRRNLITGAASFFGMLLADPRETNDADIKEIQKKVEEKKLQEAIEVESYKKSREYQRPVPGEVIKIENANFSIFPEKLNFVPGKNLLIVSRVWQTAALYGPNGEKVFFRGDKEKPIQFLVGTGRPGNDTPLGFLEVIKHEDGNYRSHEYSVRGKISKGDLGAPMPFATKIQEFIYTNSGEKKMKPFRGIAIHGRNTVNKNTTRANMSHGCIGTEIGKAKALQEVLKVGDLVLVVDESINVK